MAEDLRHPRRVVGLHFFNPVAVLPLVEVVRGEKTDDVTLATAFAVAKNLKKSGVLVKDATAFVVNRVLLRCLGDVLAAIDDGMDASDADHALDELGLPMSPLQLLDLVGLPIALHVAETLRSEFPERFTVPGVLVEAVARGKTTLLTWNNGRQELDPELVLSRTGDGSTDLTSDNLRDRVLAALAEEIGLMLDEGVVADAADIDLCMILGAGWPFHLGGITPYLQRTGKFSAAA